MTKKQRIHEYSTVPSFGQDFSKTEEENDLKIKKLEVLLTLKDQEINYLKENRQENEQLADEVQNLAQILQKTQETLTVVAEENQYLKEAVSLVYQNSRLRCTTPEAVLDHRDLLDRLQTTEKAARLARSEVADLKGKLESTEKENYTLRCEATSPKHKCSCTPEAADHFAKLNKDLSKKISKLKAYVFHQDVSAAKLKKENLKLKDQIVHISKNLAHMGSQTIAEALPGEHRKSAMHITKVAPPHPDAQERSRHVGHSKSSAKLLPSPDPRTVKENPRTQVPRRGRLQPGGDILRVLDPNVSQAAYRTIPSRPRPGLDPRSESTATRAQSVSLLGQKLASLEEELREEKDLNHHIKKKISKMVFDKSASLFDAVGSQPEAQGTDDQRSTTKTIDTKRGNVLKAFSHFADKIKRLQQADDL